MDLILVIDLLSRTPLVVRAQLAGLPKEVLEHSFGEGWMSPRATIAHFIEGERLDWMPRVHQILEQGTSETFTPFDPHSMYGWLGEQTIEELCSEFAALRLENLKDLKRLELGEKHFVMRGRHPSFGEVTMEQLLSTWVSHDHYHLTQLHKSLAHYFKNDIGPWSEYLGLRYESP